MLGRVAFWGVREGIGKLLFRSVMVGERKCDARSVRVHALTLGNNVWEHDGTENII